MVGLDASDGRCVELYVGVQDGGAIYVFEYRGGGALGFVGDFGCEEESEYGE